MARTSFVTTPSPLSPLSAKWQQTTPGARSKTLRSSHLLAGKCRRSSPGQGSALSPPVQQGAKLQYVRPPKRACPILESRIIHKTSTADGHGNLTQPRVGVTDNPPATWDAFVRKFQRRRTGSSSFVCCCYWCSATWRLLKKRLPNRGEDLSSRYPPLPVLQVHT